MTDKQFEALLAGAAIASEEQLYRLANLLNAVAAVGNEASDSNVATLLEWGCKVANDLSTHRRNGGSRT